MTEIYYSCKGKNGESYFTASLPEAKNFVQKFGGSYVEVKKTTKSVSEPHCMKNHRTVSV